MVWTHYGCNRALCVSLMTPCDSRHFTSVQFRSFLFFFFWVHLLDAAQHQFYTNSIIRLYDLSNLVFELLKFYCLRFADMFVVSLFRFAHMPLISKANRKTKTNRIIWPIYGYEKNKQTDKMYAHKPNDITIYLVFKVANKPVYGIGTYACMQNC